MFLVFVLFILFATTFVFGEAAISYVSPIFLVGVRMLFASVLLSAYQFVLNRSSLRLRSKDIPLIIITSIFLMYITYAVEFWSFQYISGAKVALIWNLSPFFTALIAYFALKEIMTVKKFLGLVIGFLGFIPVLVAPTAEEAGMISLLNITWPEFLLALSVMGAAYGWILFRHVMDRGYQPLVINAYAMCVAGILCLITSYFLEGPWDPVPVYNMIFATGYTIYLTVVGNVICFNLYGYLLKRYSTTYLSFCGSMTPLFAAIIQYFYLGKAVGIPFIVTLILVSFGLYIFYQEELRQGYVK